MDVSKARHFCSFLFDYQFSTISSVNPINCDHENQAETDNQTVLLIITSHNHAAFMANGCKFIPFKFINNFFDSRYYMR